MRTGKYVTASDAARRLGISIKALRIYEQRGLIAPERNRSGWRLYGPEQMSRAEYVVALRKLGIGLARIAAILDGGPSSRASILAEHRAMLETQVGCFDRAFRTDDPPARERNKPVSGAAVSFDLPWPWGGERFDLAGLPPLSYITGPLGSGKTRFAMRLAEALPGASFLGLDRLDAGGARYLARLDGDPGLRQRAARLLRVMQDHGTISSTPLTVLAIALGADDAGPLVIDMVEDGLCEPSQRALMTMLRRRTVPSRPLILMTRSTAILDLAQAESGETIVYCPASHAPPLIVRPDRRSHGYEAVGMCLAPPDVRALTAGMIALLPRPAAAAP